MACFNPLKGFYTGLKTANGEDLLIIRRSEFVTVPVRELLRSKYEGRYDRDVELIEAFERINPSKFPYVSDGLFYRFKTIPCGKCLGCRLSYSRVWAIRMMKELESVGGRGLFLTLTYDNKHIPVKSFSCDELDWFPPLFGGDFYGYLLKRDVQLFNKRLRKFLFGNQKGDLRYLVAGEYGSKTFRPHYHGIYLNVDFSTFPDLKLLSKNDGEPIYQSQKLDELWGNGGVIVGSVTFESVAYVARYVVKKAGSCRSDKVPPAGVEFPEFLLMSRRPGLGKPWFEKHHSEIFALGEMPVLRKDGVYMSGVPQRFKVWEKNQYQSEFEKLKEKKKFDYMKGSKDFIKTENIEKKEEMKRKIAEELQKIKQKLIKRVKL